MAHLIFSRAANNGILSNADIQTRAPAVFAHSKAGHLTDRYVALHTADLLPVMADYGYFPTQAAQKRSRKAEGAEHAHHLVAFSHRSDICDADAKEFRSEIVLYNSHDGTGAVKLHAGAFRFICSNGIIAGDGFSSVVYHNRSAIYGFEEMLRSTVANLPKMMEKIERMRSTTLTHDQAFSLAANGVLTRWDSYNPDVAKTGCYAVAQTTKDALLPTRKEDEGYDAWKVLQRVQEAVIRGNAMVRSVSATHPQGVMRKARPINSVKKAIEINQQLWDVAEYITEIA
jgi:hypothetical protein